MIGKLSQNLENGDYLIKWTIVGKDGHPIQGEVPFSVQIESSEFATDLDETQSGQVTNSEESAQETFDFVPILIAALAVVVVFGLIILFRKNKQV